MSMQASSFVASQEFSGNFPGSSLWGNKISPSQNKITPAVIGTIFSPQETKNLSLNGIKKSLVSIGPFQYKKSRNSIDFFTVYLCIV
jgi:hypothetical protein